MEYFNDDPNKREMLPESDMEVIIKSRGLIYVNYGRFTANNTVMI
jgi:hypothetical protein